MTVIRVERVSYGVTDVGECARFFTDFGLEPIGGNDFATLTGQVVSVREAADPRLPPPVEPGSSLREIVWGLDTQASLDCLAEALATDRDVQEAGGEYRTVDETGFGVGLALASPRPACVDVPASNRTGAVGRWNTPLTPPPPIRPTRLIHVALDIP